MLSSGRMPFRLQSRRYRLPFRTPLRTAHGQWREREGLLIRVEDEAGRIGYGEIAPLPEFGTETLAEAEAVCQGFGGRIGADVLAAVPERFGCVRFAVGCALEGAAQWAEREAQSARRNTGGAPREERSGGSRDAEVERDVPARSDQGGHVPALARDLSTAPGTAPAALRLPVAALLSAGKEALAQLGARIEAGYLAFKWKVGVGRVEDELGILDDLLAALPSFARLRLDANGGWDRRQAARWLVRCAERPIEFIEQPLDPRDEDGLRGLAADYPVTLALDESVVRLAEARRWQAAGWAGVFVIKPALCGPLREIEGWARATSADVVLSSAIETVVGRAAILPWALRSGVTKRALGFGLGEVFVAPAANGPALGALAEAHWAAAAGTGAVQVWESAEVDR